MLVALILCMFTKTKELTLQQRLGSGN